MTNRKHKPGKHAPALVARCIVCKGEAWSDGTRPAVIKHKKGCPEK